MPTEISSTTAGANKENKFEPMLVQTAVLLFAIVVTAFAINSLMSGGPRMGSARWRGSRFLAAPTRRLRP
jgi:hypothetical protein